MWIFLNDKIKSSECHIFHSEFLFFFTINKFSPKSLFLFEIWINSHQKIIKFFWNFYWKYNCEKSLTILFFKSEFRHVYQIFHYLHLNFGFIVHSESFWARTCMETRTEHFENFYRRFRPYIEVNFNVKYIVYQINTNKKVFLGEKIFII